LQFILQSHQI